MNAPHTPFILAIGADTESNDLICRFLAAFGMSKEIAILVVLHGNTIRSDDLIHQLQASTPLVVMPAMTGDSILPGCVFVAPYGYTITIWKDCLHLASKDQSEGAVDLIDMCFQSIAEQMGRRVAGVFFSVHGEDGVLGLEALTYSAAVTLIQDPKIAEHSNVSQAAINRNIASHIGTPEKLAEEALLQIGKASKDGAENVLPQIESYNIREICEVLKEAGGDDFRHYKLSTLARRIMRRINIAKLASANEYLSFLRGNYEEIHALKRDLLIGVTNFFRDPSAFKVLASSALVPLIKKGTEPIRIWVAGCGTGQEAYSIGISATEICNDLDCKRDIQIFATDLNERSLSFARRGIYSETQVQDLEPARLETFFEQTNNYYQVHKELRKMIVFSSHNLISDPPFYQLDLISCRNVLIY